jgi:hypothetical protein
MPFHGSLRMKLDDIELHDGLITGLQIDVIGKSVKIFIDFYPTIKASTREKIIMEFSDVESISQLMNISKINRNRSAGNINYWIPDEGSTTYIYLIDGCIEIKAKTISIANVTT